MAEPDGARLPTVTYEDVVATRLEDLRERGVLSPLGATALHDMAMQVADNSEAKANIISAFGFLAKAFPDMTLHAVEAPREVAAQATTRLETKDTILEGEKQISLARGFAGRLLERRVKPDEATPEHLEAFLRKSLKLYEDVRQQRSSSHPNPSQAVLLHIAGYSDPQIAGYLGRTVASVSQERMHVTKVLKKKVGIEALEQRFQTQSIDEGQVVEPVPVLVATPRPYRRSAPAVIPPVEKIPPQPPLNPLESAVDACRAHWTEEDIASLQALLTDGDPVASQPARLHISELMNRYASRAPQGTVNDIMSHLSWQAVNRLVGYNLQGNAKPLSVRSIRADIASKCALKGTTPDKELSRAIRSLISAAQADYQSGWYPVAATPQVIEQPVVVPKDAHVELTSAHQILQASLPRLLRAQGIKDAESSSVVTYLSGGEVDTSEFGFKMAIDALLRTFEERATVRSAQRHGGKYKNQSDDRDAAIVLGLLRQGRGMGKQLPSLEDYVKQRNAHPTTDNHLTVPTFSFIAADVIRKLRK